ncbi:hypothetical protein Y032_0295g1647 [Ancylostoma ceylanicum]|nr:hypothetical protein Y032_0295g1647 [Ancylostoma ceylanicum]
MMKFKSGSQFNVVGLQISRYKDVAYFIYGNGPCVAAVPFTNDDVMPAPASELMVFYPKENSVENIAVIESHGIIVATSGNLYSIFRFADLLDGSFLCTSRVYSSPDANPFIRSYPSFAGAVSIASKTAIISVVPYVEPDYVLIRKPLYDGESPDTETNILVDTMGIAMKGLARLPAKSKFSDEYIVSHVDELLEKHKFVSRVANVKNYLELLGVNVMCTTDGSLHVGWCMESTGEERLEILVKKGIHQLCQLGRECFLTGDWKGVITAWRVNLRSGARILGKLRVPFGPISSLYMVEEKHLFVGSCMGGISRLNNIVKWPTVEECPVFPGQQKLPTFIQSFIVYPGELYAILHDGSIWQVRDSGAQEVTPSSEQGFRQMSYSVIGVKESDAIGCAHNGCYVWFARQCFQLPLPSVFQQSRTSICNIVKIASGCENCSDCKSLPPIRAVFPLSCGVLLENIGEFSLWTYEGNLIKFLNLPKKHAKFKCTAAIVSSNARISDPCLILGGENGELMFADADSDRVDDLQEALIPSLTESGRIADMTNHPSDNTCYILSGRRTLCISLIKVLAWRMDKTVLKLDFIRYDYICNERRLRPGKFHWNSGKLYVSAFSKGDFLLYNTESQAVVLRIPCGSANIRWQFQFGQKSVGSLYMLRKGRVECKKQKIVEPKFLKVPIHSAPVTCVVIIRHTDREVFVATGAMDGTVAVSKYTLQTRTWTRECFYSSYHGSITCMDVADPATADDRFRMLASGTSQGCIRIDLLDFNEVKGKHTTVTNSLCYYTNDYFGQKVRCLHYWVDGLEGFVAIYKDFVVKMMIKECRWLIQRIVGFGFPLHSVFLGMSSLGLERCRRSLYAYGATKDVHVYSDISAFKKSGARSSKLTSYKGKFEVLDEPVTHMRMLMLALTWTPADCWVAAGRSGKIRLTVKRSFQEKEPLYFLEINYHKAPIKGLHAPFLDPAREGDRDKANIASLSADGCVAVHKVFFATRKTLCEISLLVSCVTAVSSPRALVVLPHRWGQYLIVGDSLEVVRLREKDPKDLKREKKSPRKSKT